jgi:hypothetical protein
MHVWTEAMLLVLQKSPRMFAPRVGNWRWEHVHDMNVPVWCAWVNCYSAGDLPDVAANFLASATAWALHEQARVDMDIIRLRGDPPKVYSLATDKVLSRVAHCHAIARVADAHAAHLGHVHRCVFIEAIIERAIHTTRNGLHALPD